MTPTSQSWLPSFVGYLGDGWISPAWCIVSDWLSTWACSALKGHRSSMCFAVLHEGWREMQICGDHCYKGKAGIRFRIGVHLRRRGKIKNNSVHCGALCNVKNSPKINIFLSGEEKSTRSQVWEGQKGSSSSQGMMTQLKALFKRQIGKESIHIYSQNILYLQRIWLGFL